MSDTLSGDPGFVLLVERGQTRYPERPINSQRFLIGAGSNCHLQLAGDVPLLHSIVVPDDAHLWMDAVSPYPQLIINGRPVRESRLRAGDVVEIGAYVFTVGHKRPSVPAVMVEEQKSAERSAAELIESIEVELNHLENVRRSREAGASALLQAARSAGGSAQSPLAAPAHPSAAKKIRSLLEELRLRAEALDLRETILEEHARQLEATQRQLQEQLDAACARVAQESESQPPLRLTA